MTRKQKDGFDPELLKILRIFGIASLSFVLILSFFNEKRADNTGEDPTFRITDASRIYFGNIRRAYYQVEGKQGAGLDIYRLGKRVVDSTQNVLNLAIVMNRSRNTAYLYVEPHGRLENQNPLEIRWKLSDTREGGTISFSFGDRHSHLVFVKEIISKLEKEAGFEAKLDDAWVSILENETERKAFMTTAKDYFRLVAG
jgi:hypothetical protein